MRASLIAPNKLIRPRYLLIFWILSRGRLVESRRLSLWRSREISVTDSRDRRLINNDRGNPRRTFTSAVLCQANKLTYLWNVCVRM